MSRDKISLCKGPIRQPDRCGNPFKYAAMLSLDDGAYM